MNMLLSTCGCSIAHAKFAHNQVATHWYPQHKRETKVVHTAKMDPSPMYSTTLISGTKLLGNRLRSQFLLSSNYTSSDFQLRSYSSNGESSDSLSTDQDPSEHDTVEEHWTLLVTWLLVALAALTSIAVGAILLSPKFGVPLKQSIPCVAVIIGLSLAFMLQRRLRYLLGALNLLFVRSPVKEGAIKAQADEEQVAKRVLTFASLINSKELTGIIPLSLFFSQVIVEMSGIKWCANLNKIPVQINDFNKYQLLATDIKAMLQTCPKVFLGNDAPFCYLARFNTTSAELVFGFNLVSMKKDELFACEQDILLRVLRIIRQHGAEPDINPIHLKWC